MFIKVEGNNGGHLWSALIETKKASARRPFCIFWAVWRYRNSTSSKGLNHTILGNFSTDRMVIELTVQNYRRTLTKHREAKKGHGWTKLERIEMD